LEHRADQATLAAAMEALIDTDPGPARLLLGALLAARLVEFSLARRNAERLIAEGAVEFGADIHVWLPLVHATWLATLMFASADAGPWWPAVAAWAPVAAYRVLAAWRVGRNWTTRLLRLPDGRVPDMRAADAALCVEFVVLPFAFGLWWAGPLFAAAGIAAVTLRRRAEKAFLAADLPVD
jgi:methyltransferase